MDLPCGRREIARRGVEILAQTSGSSCGPRHQRYALAGADYRSVGGHGEGLAGLDRVAGRVEHRVALLSYERAGRVGYEIAGAV
jgi:hypothetical protein